MSEWVLLSSHDHQPAAGRLWAEHNLKGGWIAALRLVPDSGYLVIGEIRIFPDLRDPECRPGEWAYDGGDRRPLPGGGVTKQLMESVPLRDFWGWLRYELETREDGLREAFLAPDSARVQSALTSAGVRAAGRPGRRGISLKFLAQVAERYVALVQAGKTRPIPILAMQFGRPPSTVKRWIMLARDKGLLTDVVPGRASGTLTAEAEALLTAGPLEG